MSKRHQSIALLLVLGCTALFYWQGLSGPFLFDDYSNLPARQVESLDLTELKDAVLTNQSGRLRRPIANLSFALNFYFFGDESFSFKLVNLGIHLVCGVLVFLLVRRLVSLVHRRIASPDPGLVALLAAGIWLLHPIQVSTVLYVVQRMAQLSTLFAFLAALAWLRWRTGLSGGTWRRGFAWFAVIALCTLLSLFSKESGALIPLLLLVLEVVVFRFACEHQARARWAVFNGLLIALPLALGLIYTLWHWDNFVGGYLTRNFSLPDRLLTEVHAIWHYIRLIFVPDLRAMGLYYDDFPITRSLDVVTLVMGAGIVALIGAALWLIRRQPIFSLGVLWFFAGHALESTFIALEPAFEHRNYLPLLGPALIVGYYVPLALRHAGRLRRVAIGGMVIVLLTMSALTLARVNIWSSKLSFLQTQLVHHPTSFRVKLELLNGALRAGNWDGALRIIAESHRKEPDNAMWPLMRLFVACKHGKLPDRWVPAAVSAIREGSVYQDAVQAIRVLANRKRLSICPPISLSQVSSLAEAAIENPVIQHNGRLRALLWVQKARLHVLGSEFRLATDAYMRAWRINPDVLTPLVELANLQMSLGAFEEARETISVVEQIVASKPLGIGESWVEMLRARFSESVAESQTKQDGGETLKNAKSKPEHPVTGKE